MYIMAVLGSSDFYNSFMCDGMSGAHTLPVKRFRTPQFLQFCIEIQAVQV